MIKALSRFFLLSLLAVAPVFAGPVNINTAPAEEIAKELNGIGPSKAQAIVAFRDQHGAFATVDQLLQVKGVGQKTLEKNRENILLGSAE